MLERRAIDRAVRKLDGARERYQVSLPPGGRVEAPHDDDAGHDLAMCAAFGTTSIEFALNSIDDLAGVLRKEGGLVPQKELNAALAFVDAGEPENEIEAALLVQMAGTHIVAQQALRSAAQSPMAATDGGYGNLAVKLMRTFTAQVEALTKLRRGGEQVVRHVHVDNRGGQAVITETVQTGGGQNGKGADQCQATGFEDAGGSALPGPNPIRQTLPITSGEGAEKVPNARRHQSRCPERE
jgi:hypothetical protein